MVLATVALLGCTWFHQVALGRKHLLLTSTSVQNLAVPVQPCQLAVHETQQQTTCQSLNQTTSPETWHPILAVLGPRLH